MQRPGRLVNVVGRLTEQVKTELVNLDHETEHFRWDVS